MYYCVSNALQRGLTHTVCYFKLSTKIKRNVTTALFHKWGWNAKNRDKPTKRFFTFVRPSTQNIHEELFCHNNIHHLSWVRISLLLSCITRLWKPPVATADHDLRTVVGNALFLYGDAGAATIYQLGGARPWPLLTSEGRSMDRRQAMPLHHHLRWARITFFLDRTASSLRESIHGEMWSCKLHLLPTSTPLCRADQGAVAGGVPTAKSGGMVSGCSPQSSRSATATSSKKKWKKAEQSHSSAKSSAKSCRTQPVATQDGGTTSPQPSKFALTTAKRH